MREEPEKITTIGVCMHHILSRVPKVWDSRVSGLVLFVLTRVK